MAVKSPRTWKTATNDVVTWTYRPDHPKSTWGEYGTITCTGCLVVAGDRDDEMLTTSDAHRHASACREFQSS